MIMLNICLKMREGDLLRRRCSLIGRYIPFLMLSFRFCGPSTIIFDKQIGVKLENNDLPCIPTMLLTPMRSEQLKIAERLLTGRSILPGLVRSTSCMNFWAGYTYCLRNANGFAPENDYFCQLMQQSPQKTYEQYSQTSQSLINECLPFFQFHSKQRLFPFVNSSSRNLLNPLSASISACISLNKSPRLSSSTTQFGRLLVPSPTAITSNFSLFGSTSTTEASTTKMLPQCSLRNLRLYAVLNFSHVACLMLW